MSAVRHFAVHSNLAQNEDFIEWIGIAMKILILVILLGISFLPDSGYTADATIPKEILAKIKAKAINEHPGNASTQNKVIKNQIAAYKEIETYQNKNVPVTVLNKIKINISLNHPFNYTTQLFFMNQQVNLYMKLGLLGSHLFPAEIVECEELRWRLAVNGKPATYRGTLKPGTVDVIYVEVRGRRGLIGQNFGFPNPGGAWEVMVWGDHNISRKHREKFLCEKF